MMRQVSKVLPWGELSKTFVNLGAIGVLCFLLFNAFIAESRENAEMLRSSVKDNCLSLRDNVEQMRRIGTAVEECVKEIRKDVDQQSIMMQQSRDFNDQVRREHAMFLQQHDAIMQRLDAVAKAHTPPM